jgi:hypothetical protein
VAPPPHIDPKVEAPPRELPAIAEPQPAADRTESEPTPATEPDTSLCGTKCKVAAGLGTGAVLAVGVAAGAEVTKDIIVGGLTVAGGSTAIKAAGAAGGAVAGKIIIDGVADHVMPPSLPPESPGQSGAEKPETPPSETASANQTDGEGTEGANQPAQGELKGEFEQIRKNATLRHRKESHGAQGELDAATELVNKGQTVERLPDSKIQGRTNPDFLINEKQLLEIKSRNTPVTREWIQNSIKNSNVQFRDSGISDNPQGFVQLRLTNQGKPDIALLEEVVPMLDRVFHAGQYTKVIGVYIIHEGRLLAEWSRVGGQIIKTVFQK